jgi:hypothetical protein
MKTFNYTRYFPYFALFFGLVFILLRLIIMNSKGTDIAGIEQNVIYSIQVLLDSGNLYQSPSLMPFSITQYTPIYYFICGFSAKMIGVDINENIQGLYIIGRFWNIIFNLITAWLVYKISRSIFQISLYKSWFLFLLSFAITFSHNFAVRPDSLHDTFGIASIYLFLLYQNNSKRTAKSMLLLGFTVLLTALAVFTKQSGIQFILIFLGFSVLIWDLRTFVKTMFLMVIIYGILFFVFQYNYPFFLENVVGGIKNGIDLQNFIKMATKITFILTVWPLIIITAFLLIKNKTIFKGSLTIRLLSICVLGTFIFAAVTALKMGSTLQYYVVFINLALILIFKFIQDYQDAFSLKVFGIPRRAITLSFYIFLTLVIFVYFAINVKVILSFDYSPFLEKQRIAALEVADFILNDRSQEEDKYILSNLTTDYNIPSRQRLNNIFFKNCLVPQMDILEYSTGQLEVMGYQKLEEMISNGEVEYIIESSPKSNFVILSNLEEIKSNSFKLIKSIDGYLIYKYLPKQYP